MAEMTIRRFGVFSVAKMQSLLMGIIGLIVGVIYGFIFIFLARRFRRWECAATLRTLVACLRSS